MSEDPTVEATPVDRSNAVFRAEIDSLLAKVEALSDFVGGRATKAQVDERLSDAESHKAEVVNRIERGEPVVRDEPEPEARRG